LIERVKRRGGEVVGALSHTAFSCPRRVAQGLALHARGAIDMFVFMRRLVALTVMTGALSACSLFPDKLCGPETREVRLLGDVRDTAQVQVGQVAVYLQQTRTVGFPASLDVVFFGVHTPTAKDLYAFIPGPLLNHVLSASLRDAGNNTVRQFDPGPPSSYQFMTTAMSPLSGTAGDSLRARFLTNVFRTELVTDISGMLLISVPMHQGQSPDWHKNPCM
jgi:hypothetical protein